MEFGQQTAWANPATASRGMCQHNIIVTVTWQAVRVLRNVKIKMLQLGGIPNAFQCVSVETRRLLKCPLKSPIKITIQ